MQTKVRRAGIRVLVLLLLSLCVPAARAQDRTALLDGVKEIVTGGGIPGDFVVFGPQAFVVLTGRSGSSRLPMIAAAHYGRGRAVAAGHEAFFGSTLTNPDNARLALNIAQWTGGKRLAELRIGLLNQDAALADLLTKAGGKVTVLTAKDLPNALKNEEILWLNQASLDGEPNRVRVAAVRKWVFAGGGVVLDGPAWGWQEVTGRDLTRDHSGSQILLPMGIAFSNLLLEPTGERGFIVSADADPLMQADIALDRLEAQAAGKAALTAAQQEQATATLSQALAALPRENNRFVRRIETLCADKGAVIPTKETPVTRAMPFARLNAVLEAQQVRQLPPDKVKANPAAANFPGLVPDGAKRETRTVTIDTRVPQWHGVGLFAPAGQVVTITIPQNAAKKGLAVRIGSHTDTLWHLDKWERFPEISLLRPLDKAVTQVASPFGGTLFVVVPAGCTLGEIAVTLGGGVAAPRYVRGQTTAEAWNENLRNAPAPWAEMEGRLVILSVPSAAVRDLEDPETLMAYWDEVMEKIYAFYAAPRRNRPERYCVDRQISAGYMHSGYPIMTWEDVAKRFCDIRQLRGSKAISCWGFYHEMGHNFQQPEWTWDAFGEVTNNLFSLYGTETFNGAKVGGHPAMTEAEMQKRLKIIAAAPGKEAYYEKDPWYPLTMFFLLKRAFGWEPFTRLFAEFRALPDAQKPRTEAEKHDQFLIRFSKLTGHNLTNYLDFWGISTSAEAKAAVANLPDWMPPDIKQ